jgi:type I restriction enzyme, S subunit
MTPNGWKKVRFGDVIDKLNDKVQNRDEWKFDRYIGGQHFDEGEIRVTKSAPIKGNEEVIGSAFHMRFKPGQVLYVTRNPRLRKGGMVDFEGVCSNVSFVLEADEKQLLQSLLPFIIQTEDFVKHTTNNAHGSTNPFLNWKDIAKYEFFLPPLEEQKKISEVLWSVEDNIKKIYSYLESLNSHYFRLLNELWLPNIDMSKLRKLKIESAPKEWKNTILIQLSKDGINNGVFNDPNKVGKGFRLINVKDMYLDNQIDVEKLSLIDLSEKEFKRSKVEREDVFFTRSSLVVEGIAHCNINLSNRHDLTYDGHVMRIRPNEEIILPLYLLFYCKTVFARKYLEAHGKTTALTTISQKDVGSLPVIYPSIDKQKISLKYLKSCKTVLDKSKNTYINNKKLRNKLSNELLSGNLRLK